jgi:hypothetical protein
VARETHPASFSVPDDESLGDWRRRRPGWRGAGHLCPAFRARISHETAVATKDTVGGEFAGWFQFQPIWQRISKDHPDIWD